MPFTSIEGIILNTLPFKENDRIVTLFTELHGVIKLFFSRPKKGTLIEPFTRGEFICRKGNGEFYRCQEITPSHYNLHLRESLNHLKAAYEMQNIVARTQLPEKPAPLLYHLFNRYIKELGNVATPEILVTSFFLKLLLHEGVIGEIHLCSTCQKTIEHLSLFQGESFCKEHALEKGAIHFNPQEAQDLSRLLYSRKMEELIASTLSKEFGEKVKKLTEQLL